MRRYVVSYTGRNAKRHTERWGTAVEICSPGCTWKDALQSEGDLAFR